ncbi:PRC-barrel domain containing protein [Streptacidiphilus sp. PB12-B1b]|uniref:PRC-barrel domain containing protein n=1 Tax=Streptacidiphilus sp. PB12-B1b TaxID=2705012 RepID=UPI0015FB0894|nr:PRC-barrel domain containing protein [Streptacidiphilus sp. PB12-B1b]QMU77330.1 PRC-barrel domain containing protein [Streptacidiphilus sp. PB12-B1b]
MPTTASSDALWDYRENTGRSLGMSVTGFTVRASDGRVGTVLRTHNDPGRAHLIVTTGPWVFGQELAIPAGLITKVDPEHKTVVLACSRAQAKQAPRYRPDAQNAWDSYRESATDYYTSAEPMNRLAP